MSAAIPISPDREQIRRAIEVLCPPDAVIELRALHKGKKATTAGYFDAEHREQLIDEAVKLNESGAAVYMTLNLLDSQLLARTANRVQPYVQATATDNNVLRRCWLLVDIDPQRPKDTSATGEQLAAATDRARKVYAFLAERGWSEPVVGESGNGLHLYYRIDLPNDEASRDVVKHCLEALAAKFDDEAVRIDRSVFNAARIVKLLGTVANKGDNVPSAPWRLSRLRKVPKTVTAVSLEQLQALAAEVASKANGKTGGTVARAFTGTAWGEQQVNDFLAKAGIETSGPEPHAGALRWKLRTCPFNADHVNGEAAVLQLASGALVFKCLHNGCADRRWEHLRELVDGPRETRAPANPANLANQAARFATLATFAGGDIEPETLRRPLPPAEPYPIEALGPVLGPAARRIHEVVQAPSAMCGQSILAAASLAVQPHADVWIDGRRELLSLYAFTIGLSGERKSAVDGHALAPHRDYERAAFDKHRMQATSHEIAMEAHAAQRRAITRGGKDSDAESISKALLELGPPPQAPQQPILLAPSPTLEGIHKLYAVGRPSLGLFHDDAGEFLGGHAMSEDNRLKSAAGFSRLWDAGEFDRIRAGDGAHKYFGRRLAMHLMVQPVVAEGVLSDDILTGQGLLARALLAWPESTVGDRPYVSVDLTRDPAMLAYRDRMNALLGQTPRFRDGTDNEIEPRALVLAPEARSAWIAIHDAIEADQKDGGDWASVRPWASKAASQVLRIAGVLTLSETPDAGVIHREAIERAAMLMDHYLREAVRLVGTASVPVDIRNAEALRDWCHRERKELLHSGDALQYGPNCIRTVTAFNTAIEALERTGWAERIEGGWRIGDAHRRRAWTIRRAAR
jgi:hypothetical protein